MKLVLGDRLRKEEQPVAADLTGGWLLCSLVNACDSACVECAGGGGGRGGRVARLLSSVRSEQTGPAGRSIVWRLSSRADEFLIQRRNDFDGSFSAIVAIRRVCAELPRCSQPATVPVPGSSICDERRSATYLPSQ
jgi:hypothetical protein